MNVIDLSQAFQQAATEAMQELRTGTVQSVPIGPLNYQVESAKRRQQIMAKFHAAAMLAMSIESLLEYEAGQLPPEKEIAENLAHRDPAYRPRHYDR